MTRVLLVTVGGSPEPIIQAVEEHQPEELIFICSAPPCAAPSLDQVIGAGSPCRYVSSDGIEVRRPNLVTQLEILHFDPELQVLELPDPDDLVACHRSIAAFCQALRERFSALELIGDYSGGTKTMSAALAMVLLEEKARISLVHGNRRNLVRIERSEGVRTAEVGPIRARQLLSNQLPPLLECHLYDQAALHLGDFRQLYLDSLDAQTLEWIHELQCCLAVLMHWDSFEWRQSLGVASSTALPEVFPEMLAWWQRVHKAHHWLVEQQPQTDVTGYELVQDLLLNAERRGRRGWFDDAVARLYRALELLAQTYIQLECGYDHQTFWTHPDILRDKREWNVRSGVGGLYWWLKQREGGAGLGGAASRQWFVLQELLDARNHSLLGHGLTPVNQGHWQELQDRISNLVMTALRELGCQQGPPPQQLPGRALLDLPAAQHLLGVTR